MTALVTINQQVHDLEEHKQEETSGCERSVDIVFSRRCGVMAFPVSAHLEAFSEKLLTRISCEDNDD